MAVITNFGVPTSGATQTLMPKLQYRFKVEFAGLGGNAANIPLVTTNVISVTRPQLDHEDITLDTYNSKIVWLVSILGQTLHLFYVMT